MGEAEYEMRDRLSRTWKTLMLRVMDYDFPPEMIFETLAKVATDGMLETFGASAAAQMLRLRADAIEAEESDRTRDLLAGEDDDGRAPIAPALPVNGFDGWSFQEHQPAMLDLIGRP